MLPQIPTYYSAFCLGGVSFFAHLRGHWMCLPFLILYGTSIVHHAKYKEDFPGKYCVYIVDKVIAHFLVASSMVMALIVEEVMILPMTIYWLGVGWLIYVYYIGKQSHLPGDDWIPWHATIHIVASIGIVCLLLHY